MYIYICMYVYVYTHICIYKYIEQLQRLLLELLDLFQSYSRRFHNSLGVLPLAPILLRLVLTALCISRSTKTRTSQI